MRFQVLPIIATMLAATQAAPTSQPEPHHLVARASRCGDSTFENQVSGGSPSIGDCEQLSRNIAGTLPHSQPILILCQNILIKLSTGGGTWTMGAGGEHRKIASYGTCAFGLKGAGGGSSSVIEIGNQDIIDIIRDSIGKGFTFEGKVGAKGTMPCQDAGAGHWQADMEWGIYHN
jgi:hypothetical protein